MHRAHGSTDKGIGWLVVAALFGLLGLAHSARWHHHGCVSLHGDHTPG